MRGPYRWRPDVKNARIDLDEKQLRRHVEAGGRAAEFAVMYNLSSKLVHKKVRALGLRTKPRYTPLDWTNLEPEILYRRRELGQSGRRIAAALGVSQFAVENRLRMHNLGGRVPRAIKPPKVPRPRAKAKARTEPRTFNIFLPPTVDGAGLWNRAVAAVPEKIRDLQVRQDVAQELCCGVLTGKFTENDFEKVVKKTVAKVLGSASVPGTISLDARCRDGGLTLHEFLSCDAC